MAGERLHTRIATGRLKQSGLVAPESTGMRRITVYERDGCWHVSAADREGGARHRTLLDAANAARAYGETLDGEAPGYVVRLQTAIEIGDDRSITIHTRIFAPTTEA